MNKPAKAALVAVVATGAALAYLGAVHAFTQAYTPAVAASEGQSWSVDCGAFAVTFTGHGGASSSDAGFAAVDYASQVRDVHGCGGAVNAPSPWLDARR